MDSAGWFDGLGPSLSEERIAVTSKQRMLAAMAQEECDYVPCSFMLFFNEQLTCRSQREFIEKQVAMGLDPYVHVGHLAHALHPEAQRSEWVEQADGETIFCRRIDTPAGPLTARYRQSEGWPEEGNFPLFNDYLVTRAREVMVKPEQDLEKLRYFFGPFRDQDIQALRETAAEARKIADQRGLLQLGGWKDVISTPVTDSTRGDADGGVMGCDCMAWLSGYEEIMILSLTRPDVIVEYARIIHQWNLWQIDIYLDVTDADVIWRRAWYETTEFWTPEAYRQVIAPTPKAEADRVHQAGRKYGYIITSAFLPLLDDILDTGVDVLVGLDPAQGKGTEIATVKAKCQAAKTALWGGVSGPASIELGTAEDTRAAVAEAMETLAPGGGFILSPVDNVRDDTPNARANTEVFIDAWKQQRSGALAGDRTAGGIGVSS